MSDTIHFTHRGLNVTASICGYTPATWLDPADGGYAEDASWEIDDIDEVICELELKSEGMERLVGGYWNVMGKLPQLLADHIDTWDLLTAADDYFWNEIGGPSGLADYYYDD